MAGLVERVRRARKVRWAAVVFGALLVITADLHAYYDDVHYALTYYIARQSGFTPLQAFRIASANVSTDYDPDTEPVQPTAQKLQLIGIKEFAQTPRWKFHAFRNELEFPGTAGRGVDAAAAAKIGEADLAIRVQQDQLWNRALTLVNVNTPLDPFSYGTNPGVFLHFFMDKEPHAKYGSAWGHWPLDPEFFPNAINDKLPIGGTTDWVGFRPGDVAILAEQTSGWLKQFMEKISPLQPFRPYQERDYAQLMRQLAAPFPAPIDTPLKRELYARFFGMEGIIPASRDAPVIADLASDLRGEPPANFEKQKSGPDKSAAMSAVDAALKAAGMTDSIPRTHFTYPLNSNGDLASSDPEMLDKWVLVGKVGIRVYEDKNGARAPFEGGTVTVKLAKLRANGEEAVLGQPKPIGAGQTVVFEPLPVGELVVEVRDTAGAGRGRTTITLDRREVDLELTLPPGAAPTTTARLAPDMCVFVPDGSPVDKNTITTRSNGRCYQGGPAFSRDSWYVDITQYASEEEAVKRFAPMNTTGEQRTTEFGNDGWVIRTATSFQIKFRQGPFEVRVDGSGTWKQPWERMTREIEAAIKNWTATSGARAGNAPAPGGEPPAARVSNLTPVPTPLPAAAPPPPPSTARPVPPPTAAPAPTAAPSPAPRRLTPSECAQIAQQRDTLSDTVRSVMQQIAQSTDAPRVAALRQQLVKLVEDDTLLERQELSSCR